MLNWEKHFLDIDNIDNEFKNMCKKLEISNIFYKIDENN